MPYKILANATPKGTYRVTNKETGKVYAYKTKDPKGLIAAIEINKRR